MMHSRETFIHDAELEIVVPYDILECNEENVDKIIDARQRTQIYYDELLHCYLVTTLPPESSLETKEEAKEFFKKLEINFEARLIDTHLSVPSNYSPPLIHRTLSSSSTSSSISGLFSSDTSMKSRSSSNATSPTMPGTPSSGYSIKRSSSGKYTEGSVIYSAQYNSKNKKNSEMVVVKRDDCWTCVLPLSFSVAHIKTRIQSQIALNIKVTQPQRKMTKSYDSDLYSMEHFGMNLLEGLNDDPAFASLNTSCSIPTSRLTKQDSTKRASIYSTLPSTTIKRCTRKLLSVTPTLNVRIKITDLSPSENTKMMSVELENDTENDVTFSVESVKVDVAHAFVKKFGWGQDDSNESPISLRPMDQVTYLYNVTVLEDPSFPTPSNTQQYCPTPDPHSRTSSRRTSIASINPILNALPVENRHRPLSVIVNACPVIDGVKSRCVESRWNCMLEVPTLSMDDTMSSSQLEEVGTKHAPMLPTICDDKFNYNKPAVAHDLFSSYNEFNNYKSLQNNDNSGLEINVNGVDNCNKKYYSGCPEINLSDDNSEKNGILPSGRLPKSQKQAGSNVCDDVAVSFAVCGKPVVGKVFAVKVSMLNKSKHAKNFTLAIPNKKVSNERLRRPLTPRTLLSQTTDITLVESNDDDDDNYEQTLEGPFMNETELLRKHSESELLNADLICLDNNVKVGPIIPFKNESVTLHFISTKAASQMVESVQLIDDDTGFMTNFRDVVQVNVDRPYYPKYERRIDRNPVVLRNIEVMG